MVEVKAGTHSTHCGQAGFKLGMGKPLSLLIPALEHCCLASLRSRPQPGALYPSKPIKHWTFLWLRQGGGQAHLTASV